MAVPRQSCSDVTSLASYTELARAEPHLQVSLNFTYFGKAMETKHKDVGIAPHEATSGTATSLYHSVLEII